MTTKTIGILVLFLTALQYSWRHQMVGQRCCAILTELCQLLAHIRKSIDCFALPLNEIGKTYTSPWLEKCGFLPTWRKNGLSHAIEYVPYLPNNAKAVLQQYGREAGQGYKEEELRLCRYTEEQLTDILSRLQVTHKTQCRLYRTLPFLLVLSIVLLLY